MSDTTAPQNEIILWLQDRSTTTPLEDVVSRASTTHLLRAHAQMYIFLMRDGLAKDDGKAEGRARKALIAVSDELARRIDEGRGA